MDIVVELTIYAVGCLIGIILAIPLHELGHLLFGRLTGYHFLSFRVANLLWAKSEDRIRLTKSPTFGGIAGQCLMKPCENEEDFRYILYNLGGGLVNLLTGAALFAVGGGGRTNEILFFFCLGASLMSIFTGIMNLMPLQLGGIPNDGRNIREAGKSGEAKRGLYLMFKANAEMAEGKRLQDFEKGIFSVNEDADLDNYLTATLIMQHASQLEEQGSYEQSYRELLRLKPKSLPIYYRALLELTLLFHELIHFGDEASVTCARERYEKSAGDKVFRKFLHSRHPSFLPFQAAKVAYIEGNEDKARELIGEARSLAPSLQNPGMEHSILLLLEKLEEKLEVNLKIAPLGDLSED